VNVSCPECRSVFRVDPTKIPSGGIRARCSVCGGVISIGAGASVDEEFAPSGAPATPRAPTPGAQMAQAADVVPAFQGAHGSGGDTDSPPAREGAADVVPAFQGAHGSGDESDAAPQGAAAFFESQTVITEEMEATPRPTGSLTSEEPSPIASPVASPLVSPVGSSSVSPAQLNAPSPSAFDAPPRTTPLASSVGATPVRPMRTETPPQRVTAPTHAPAIATPSASSTAAAPVTPPRPASEGVSQTPASPGTSAPSGPGKVPLVDPSMHTFGVGRPAPSTNVPRPFVPPLAPRPSAAQTGAQPGTSPSAGQPPVRPSTFPPRPVAAPVRSSMSTQPTPPSAPTSTPAPGPHIPRQTAPVVRPSLGSQATPAAAPPTQGVPTPSVAATPSAASTPAGSRPPSGTPTRVPINPFLANDPNAKARRLARALVSDLVTYFPQKRDEGLRNGNLKELFREEIKKSYEEFVDQVGKDFAESTPHFQDALNDILAAGQKIF